jgi:CHAD domain-containing protein
MILASPRNSGKKSAKTTGLRYWMARVLDECDNVAADFSADPVHDLRVALRRCRSVADGLIAIDPDPEWNAMKKAGKRLFQRLGALRDVQIMMEWIKKLFPVASAAESSVAGDGVARALLPALSQAAPTFESVDHAAAVDSGILDLQDPVVHALLEILLRRESEQKREAQGALEEFDRKQWRQWTKSLPQRAAHLRPGNLLFKHLALERWMAAHDLHNRALRNRSQVAFHTLRIGIKRFRYIVENFLPEEHKAWSRDLKEMQDLLGEVHDLDVLWATALSCHVFPDEESRQRWHSRIVEERTARLDRYRKKMTGADALWNIWRVGLPQGKQIQAIATRRMKHWAKVLDPDFPHAERVARLSLELYDGLKAMGLLPSFHGSFSDGENLHVPQKRRDIGHPVQTRDVHARDVLSIAALLHDVGKSEGDKGHHKASYELIRAHPVPVGWNAGDLQRAAVVARFHRGALPARSHKTLRDLLPDEQRLAIELAAILRLANAFDVSHDGNIRRVWIENAPAKKERSRRANGLPRKVATLAKGEALVIAAEGYSPNSSAALTIAAERHLLEIVLRRPVVVKAASVRVAVRVLRTAS